MNSNSYLDLHVSRSEIQHLPKITTCIKITVFSACVDIHVLIPNRYIEFFATSEKIAIFKNIMKLNDMELIFFIFAMELFLV